jgi:predicted transcriptional regulator of viral defense system
MYSRLSLAEVIDTAERDGRLNLRTSDLAAALPRVSPDALRQALHRQQVRGRIVRTSRGAEHWLIVPLQHANSGAPPLEIWLDTYLSKTLQTPYYVALLSAAETYGASPYAVMVTQIMVPKARRPITVGRHEIVFLTRANIERMPTQWHSTADGRFRVSTPELSALELVQREAQVGGIARVREVLRPLSESCTVDGLRRALDAAEEVPAAQRLGALLALEGKTALAECVHLWLAGHKIRTIPLEQQLSSNNEGTLDPIFKVRIPDNLERANA